MKSYGNSPPDTMNALQLRSNALAAMLVRRLAESFPASGDVLNDLLPLLPRLPAELRANLLVLLAQAWLCDCLQRKARFQAFIDIVKSSTTGAGLNSVQQITIAVADMALKDPQIARHLLPVVEEFIDGRD